MITCNDDKSAVGRRSKDSVIVNDLSSAGDDHSYAQAGALQLMNSVCSGYEDVGFHYGLGAVSCRQKNTITRLCGQHIFMIFSDYMKK